MTLHLKALFDKPRLLIFGHRGEGPTNRTRPSQTIPKNVPPENSLCAFRSSLSKGSDGIECDVMTTKDGVVVVSHDDELDRNVDGLHSGWTENEPLKLGKISEKNYDELKDASKYSIGHGETFPTLEEVIELVLAQNPAYKKAHNGKNITINIELKGTPNIVQATYKIIKKYVDDPTCPLQFQDFVLNSFERDYLERVREIHPTEDLRILLGLSGRELFGGKDKLLPGWVPVERETDPHGLGKVILNENGKPKLKKDIDSAYFDRMVNYAKEHKFNAIDIMSSDVRPYILEQCEKNNLMLAVCICGMRLRAEVDLYGSANERKKTDALLEQDEITKLYEYLKKYPKLNIVLKADNTAKTVELISKLQRASSKKCHRSS